MQICTACKRLAAAPMRLDVPSHLAPHGVAPSTTTLVPADAHTGAAARFQCTVCNSRWGQAERGTWVLWLPVSSLHFDRERERRWWGAIQEAISRWRAGRRLRVRRVAPLAQVVRNPR